MEPSCYSAGTRRRHTRRVSNRGGRRGRGRGGRATARRVGAAGRVASPGIEKSVSGQTVLRVVRRIVSDPDSRELSQTAFSSETTRGSSSSPPALAPLLPSSDSTTVRSRWLKWDPFATPSYGNNAPRPDLWRPGSNKSRIIRLDEHFENAFRASLLPPRSRRLLGIYRHLTHLTLSGTVCPLCEISASFMRYPRRRLEFLLNFLAESFIYVVLFYLKWNERRPTY